MTNTKTETKAKAKTTKKNTNTMTMTMKKMRRVKGNVFLMMLRRMRLKQTKIQAYLRAQSATLKDDFFRPEMKTVPKKKSVEISQSMFALRRGGMEMNKGQGNVMAVR